jgi:hypothetical protein
MAADAFAGREDVGWPRFQELFDLGRQLRKSLLGDRLGDRPGVLVNVGGF